jgi:YHS domain-containing protein
MAKIILWAVLFLLLVRAVSKLFRGVIEGAGYTRGDSTQRSVGLVRDPVCGVFVVPGQALTSGSGSGTRHFCSEKCRREWGTRSSR